MSIYAEKKTWTNTESEFFGTSTLKVPDGWTKCFKSDAATELLDPDTNKIIGYVTQTPFQVAISCGMVAKNWEPLPEGFNAGLADKIFTFATQAEAEEMYLQTQDEEMAEMFF